MTSTEKEPTNKELLVQYERHMRETVNPAMRVVTGKLNDIDSQSTAWQRLLFNLKKLQDKKEGEPVELLTDLGSGFHTAATVDDSSTIMMRIGLGFYLEKSIPEAIEYVEKTMTRLENETRKLNEELSSLQATASMTAQVMNSLRGLSSTPSAKP